MPDIEELIGSRITEIRLSRNLTQAQLAEKVNVSVETISRLERGVSFPSLKTMANIASALDVPLSNFFEFGVHEPKDRAFERELSKLTAFLRTMDKQELALLHDILRAVYAKLKKRH